MSKPVRVEPDAEAEMFAAADRYEHQRPGLGLEFLDEVEMSCSPTRTSTPRS
jgi:hypothetical protein